MSLKETNPDLKIMVSMGGYNEGTEIYSDVAGNATKRAIMIESVLGFLKLHDFDGFDLDWEYPAQRNGDVVKDPANYVTLLGELKDALNDEGYIFSTVVTTRADALHSSYPDGKSVSDNADMLNIKSYDLHGDWDEHVGHNAPLHESHLDETETDKNLNVAASVQAWIDFGADPKKLHLAICTYGRSFTLLDESETDLYASINGSGTEGPYTASAGMLGYNEICSLYGTWEEIWDDEQEVPHKVKGNQWIGYDNEKSIQAKVKLANELGLGGVMYWSFDTDDFSGQCGDKFPLLTTVNKYLN